MAKEFTLELRYCYGFLVRHIRGGIVSPPRGIVVEGPFTRDGYRYMVWIDDSCEPLPDDDEWFIQQLEWAHKTVRQRQGMYKGFSHENS